MTFENFKAALFSNPFFYFSRFPALLKEKSRSLMCQPLEKMGGHYTKEILAKEPKSKTNSESSQHTLVRNIKWRSELFLTTARVNQKVLRKLFRMFFHFTFLATRQPKKHWRWESMTLPQVARLETFWELCTYSYWQSGNGSPSVNSNPLDSTFRGQNIKTFFPNSKI